MTRTARFHSMYSFKYSPPPGRWPVSAVDDVTEPEKTRRIVALQQLQRSSREILDAMVGKTYDVLIDGPSRRHPDEWAGRTDGNTIVNIAWPADSRPPADLLGRFVRARVTEAGPNALKGVPC